MAKINPNKALLLRAAQEVMKKEPTKHLIVDLPFMAMVLTVYAIQIAEILFADVDDTEAPKKAFLEKEIDL